MNYELLWNIDEYQSLKEYKWNAFKYINLFLSDNLTNREINYNGKGKGIPRDINEFKKALETIELLYEAIKKNYKLNGNKEYSQKLFRGLRKNSNHLSFASTTESLETALSFINGFNTGNIDSDLLIEVMPSKVPWINIESYISSDSGGDLDENEILFLPCLIKSENEMPFREFIGTLENSEYLTDKIKRQFDKIKDLSCRKVELRESNYGLVQSDVSLDDLTSVFSQYRENLLKLNSLKVGSNEYNQIYPQIINFKRQCLSYLYSKFNHIDKKLSQMNVQEKKIAISQADTIAPVRIGNTGKMFYVKSYVDDSEYYFKPAESKKGEIKPYRAFIQQSAYDIQRIINPARAVKCNTCYINNTFGAIQEKVEIDKEATRKFNQYFYNNVGELSPELISQIMDEYLVDYCLCNYDSHTSNFIIDSAGNLRGIDKEQSFRYIREDKDDDMLFTKNYNEEYGESETIYSAIFKKISSGEISYKFLDGLAYRAARLEQVPNSEYREMFKDYAYNKTSTTEEAELLLDRIVGRKKNIVKKVDELKSTLYAKWYANQKGNANMEYVFTDNKTSDISQKDSSLGMEDHIIFPQRQQTTSTSTTTQPEKTKDDLILEKQEILRTGWKLKLDEMKKQGFEVPNLDDILRQQEIIEQQRIETERLENTGRRMM